MEELPSGPPSPDALPLLLGAARAGRAEAWREIYRRFVRVVHGIALAHVGRDDAEDVAQEVFARAFRALGTVRDPAAFPAWLCTLARNATHDARRRMRRRPRTVPLDGVEVPAPPPRDDDEELRARVLEKIGTLPDAYRETLFMRLAEGLTGAEIAARTGLTPESVRVNLSRGMALLRPLLREESRK